MTDVTNEQWGKGEATRAGPPGGIKGPDSGHPPPIIANEMAITDKICAEQGMATAGPFAGAPHAHGTGCWPHPACRAGSTSFAPAAQPDTGSGTTRVVSTTFT